MDNYVVILEKDEKVHLEQPFHWIYFTGILMTVLVGVGLVLFLEVTDMFRSTQFMGFSLRFLLQVVFSLFVLLNIADSYLNYRASSYIITNKRVIVSSGWLMKNMRDIMLHRIEGVQVVQTIPGRILNYGSVVLYGMGTCVDSLPLLADPFRFRAAIQEALQPPAEEE
jgi:uncharacterized membrane protein YdbT with pleckstrin-like domain